MENIQKHIFIIGMMCTGKSSLAPILSQKLNIPFIDIDIDLISILGLDIKEIFNVFSEEKFRLLESTYFLEHIKNKQHIYATGGGLVIEKNNRKALSNYGITILLNTPIEIIYQRLLQDVILGDQSLFIRSDEVEACWVWADSLRNMMNSQPLYNYETGSWGPNISNTLFGDEAFSWVMSVN